MGMYLLNFIWSVSWFAIWNVLGPKYFLFFLEGIASRVRVIFFSIIYLPKWRFFRQHSWSYPQIWRSTWRKWIPKWLLRIINSIIKVPLTTTRYTARHYVNRTSYVINNCWGDQNCGTDPSFLMSFMFWSFYRSMTTVRPWPLNIAYVCVHVRRFWADSNI